MLARQCSKAGWGAAGLLELRITALTAPVARVWHALHGPAAVLIAQQPGPSPVYYREELKQLVYQAVIDRRR